MDRGLVVIAGAGVLVALIAIILLAQENNQLKSEISEAKKILAVKPIQSKQIAGFGRDLAVDQA